MRMSHQLQQEVQETRTLSSGIPKKLAGETTPSSMNISSVTKREVIDASRALQAQLERVPLVHLFLLLREIATLLLVHLDARRVFLTTMLPVLWTLFGDADIFDAPNLAQTIVQLTDIAFAQSGLDSASGVTRVGVGESLAATPSMWQSNRCKLPNVTAGTHALLALTASFRRLFLGLKYNADKYNCVFDASKAGSLDDDLTNSTRSSEAPREDLLSESGYYRRNPDDDEAMDHS
eukprot:GSA25T00008138001.1